MNATGTITMTMRELDRYKVIQDVADGVLRLWRAAERLGLTTRQIRRLVGRLREHGPGGLVSGRRSKPSNNRLDTATADRVLAIIRERYADFGPTLACEKLYECHGIRLAKETVRRLMTDAGLWVPRRRRPPKVYQPRARRACVGELIQIDGSEHAWFEQRAPQCGTPELAAAQASREAGNAPNAVLAAAAAIIGPNRQRAAREAARLMIDRFAAARLTDAFDETFDVDAVESAGSAALFCDEPDPKAEAMLAGLASRRVSSAIIRWLLCGPGHPRSEAVLAAITTTLAWGPLMRKRISRLTAESLPWWTKLVGTMIGASADASRHSPDGFCDFANEELLGERSLTEIAFAALLNLKPTADDLFAFKTLVGLLLTNGPGAISAQGAKGAVSADGPESPERVQLNKALVGFLTHTGYTHGGNGYEGIAFLNEAFRGSGLDDPTDAHHTVDLEALARNSVERYAQYKARQKHTGSLDIAKLPGVNHPVFKDKPVNHDPREVFIADLYEARGEYNVFHAYYRVLVQALFDAGVSRNVYCVNVDAVIAALLLKMLWKPLKRAEFSEADLETAAFTIFLYPRMVGCAAEIDDHLNRGRNMDTRTAASQCHFVA
ncbi:helix-turn-helix domain-containing protein [Paraburkholderia phymatum]|uniref:helix-turn-helix domain-containing protein n=1 Tax=Paraburkholderia phymatum TaxID=148447 RepID=UPI00316ECF21